MSQMPRTEDVLPFIIVAAVAGFAASRFLYASTVTPGTRTPANREEMRKRKELRKVKEEFLKAQDTEIIDENEETPLVATACGA